MPSDIDKLTRMLSNSCKIAVKAIEELGCDIFDSYDLLDDETVEWYEKYLRQAIKRAKGTPKAKGAKAALRDFQFVYDERLREM